MTSTPRARWRSFSGVWATKREHRIGALRGFDPKRLTVRDHDALPDIQRTEGGQDCEGAPGVGKVKIGGCGAGQQSRPGGQPGHQFMCAAYGKALGLERGDHGAQQAVIATRHRCHETGGKLDHLRIELCGVQRRTRQTSGEHHAGHARVPQVGEHLAELLEGRFQNVRGRQVNRDTREMHEQRVRGRVRNQMRQRALPREYRQRAHGSAGRQVRAVAGGQHEIDHVADIGAVGFVRQPSGAVLKRAFALGQHLVGGAQAR